MNEPITITRLERLAARGDDEVRSVALELIEARATIEALRSRNLNQASTIESHEAEVEGLERRMSLVGETLLAVANVRSELSPEHWPQALRDIKRGGDGEPDLDEPTLELEALALDMYRERLLELQASALRAELTEEELAAATRGTFTAEWAGKYLAPHTLCRVATDDEPVIDAIEGPEARRGAAVYGLIPDGEAEPTPEPEDA